MHFGLLRWQVDEGDPILFRPGVVVHFYHFSDEGGSLGGWVFRPFLIFWSKIEKYCTVQNKQTDEWCTHLKLLSKC